MNNQKNKLIQFAWARNEYIGRVSKRFGKEFKLNAAQNRLKELILCAKRVLDCGSGSGRVLEVLYHEKARFWGIDISKPLVKKAKRRFGREGNVHFTVGDVEKLNFRDHSFDLVFSHYTMEHLDNPEEAILEMIRVLQPGGSLVIICPNYGSPLYPSVCSPNSGESLTSRALKIFISSHVYLFFRPKRLNWRKVQAKTIKEEKWEQDWDVVVEPDLQTLLMFLDENGVDVEEQSSGIEEIDGELRKPVDIHAKALRAAKLIAERLGRRGFRPYRFYGPRLFVVGKKR